MNKIILMGRLTADPELKNSSSGVSSCRFTIAVDRSHTNKNGEREADFIICVAFRKTAEFISRYFRKGKMISVEGSLRNNNYQDKVHPDVMHYTYEVFAEKAEFCGDKDKPEQVQQNGYYQPAPAPAPQNGYYQNPPPPNNYYQPTAPGYQQNNYAAPHLPYNQR